MKFSFIKPVDALVPYINAFWTFESNFGVPVNDTRLIVPNGGARIVIPYKNALTVISNDQPVTSKEQDIFLAGVWDTATTISSYAKETGTIGIDLSPKGLYRLFNLKMEELTNRIYSFEDLFGAWGKRMQYELGHSESVSNKISFLQNALVYLLNKNTKDYSLLDYVVDSIYQSDGMVYIQSLETETRYSKRYIDMQFKRYIGVSPKTLASIIKFQKFYKLWAKDDSEQFFKEDLYLYYFDQSHFIKEFKRFTGFTPKKYMKRTSEFSKAFYSQ
jgi:AraC-like DNA-binding protein